MLLIFLIFIAIVMGITLSTHYWMTHERPHRVFHLNILRLITFLVFCPAFAAPVYFEFFNENVIQLFCYYLVLNLAIFSVAEFKKWRELNYLGFLANFFFLSLWNGYLYKPGYYLSAQIFLIFYFILYFGLSLLLSYRTETHLKKMISNTLSFALPMIFFICQAKLVNYANTPLTWTAFSLAIAYALSAYLLRKFAKKNPLLISSLAHCSLILFNIGIFLLLRDSWIAAILAIEGAALLWFGKKHHQKFSIYFGLFLQVFASILLIDYFPSPAPTNYLLNNQFIAVMVVVASALYSSYISKSTLRLGFFMIAALWYIFIGFYEHMLYFKYQALFNYAGVLISHIQEWQVLYSTLLYFAVMAFIFCCLARRFNFRWLISSLGFFILFFIALELYHLNFYDFYRTYNPFIYLAILFIGYAALYIVRNCMGDKAARFFTSCFLIAFLGQYAMWVLRFNHALIPNEFSLQCGMFAIAISLYFFVFECDLMTKIFPCSFHPTIYTRTAPQILSLVFVAWFLITSISATGVVYAWPYIPLLNPLDLATGLGFFSIYYWGKAQAAWLRSHYNANLQRLFKVLVRVLLLIWLGAMVFRTLYQWTGWLH